MKIELSPIERGYVANTLRRRVDEVSQLARSAKTDQLRIDREEEAKAALTLAKKFDDGEERTEIEPIRTNPRSDLDYMDEAGGGEAMR